MSRHAAKRKPVISRVGDRLTLSFDDYTVQSEMRLDAPDELVLGYTRTMMGFLLFCPRPTRIAMIGLGGGSLAKYCRAKLDTAITVAEIDPQVIANRDRFFIPPNDETFQVQCMDGADFVRMAQRHYSILLVDGFNAAGQAPQLSTQSFYRDCYSSLAPRGLMVVNLSDQTPCFDRSLARIRHSFDRLLVIDAEGSTNKIVFAGKDRSLTPAPHSLDELSELHPSLNLFRTWQAVQAAAGAPA